MSTGNEPTCTYDGGDAVSADASGNADASGDGNADASTSTDAGDDAQNGDADGGTGD